MNLTPTISNKYTRIQWVEVVTFFANLLLMPLWPELPREGVKKSGKGLKSWSIYLVWIAKKFSPTKNSGLGRLRESKMVKTRNFFWTVSLNDATTPNGYRKDLLFLQIGFRVSKPSQDRSAKNQWPLATSRSKFNNWARATPEIEQYFIHFPHHT